MNVTWFRKTAVACLAGIAGVVLWATPAEAGSLVLGSSGWTASWDSSLDTRLGLNFQFESADAVFVEKFANFTTDDVNPLAPEFVDPLSIVFQRTSTNAKPFIVINDEAVVNQTGLTWVGFRFTIVPGTGDVRFDQVRTDISPPGSGFSIDPFTTHAYSQNDTVLELGGGVIPSGPPDNVWFPGARSGGLVINTSATQTVLDAFKLEELPIIPLPAAAWSGLSGLIGLALVGSRKHLRKLFA